MNDALKNFVVTSHGDAEVFWHKLMTENKWSKAYAKAVFDEYKKFIWLAATVNHRVVPSKVVDAVWHLNMTFTHSYWHELCGEILGTELHHWPSSAGEAAHHRDVQDYQKTLASYQASFGDPSPAFWPMSPAPDKAKRNIWQWATMAGASVLLLTACSIDSDADIWFYVKVAVGIYIVYRILRWLGSGKGGGNGNGSCAGSCASSCGGSCGGS
jgi:hypothetical protein